MTNNGIIIDRPTRNESNLDRRDNQVKNSPNSISKNLSNYDTPNSAIRSTAAE